MLAGQLRSALPQALEPYSNRLANGSLTKEDLRSERDLILNMYKHHLKLLVEANVFIYAVTGALLSFVVAHLALPHIRWVLVFPIVFDAAFAVFLWMAGRGISYNETELNLIAKALQVNVVPRLDALRLGLGVSAATLLVVAVLIGCAA
jgi:hypothetical protein